MIWNSPLETAREWDERPKTHAPFKRWETLVLDMQSSRNRKLPEGKIIKPEDRIWKEQFDHLSKDDHLEKLHLLGLDDEEAEELVEDFEEVKKGKKSKILQELEEEASAAGKEGETPEKKE